MALGLLGPYALQPPRRCGRALRREPHAGAARGGSPSLHRTSGTEAARLARRGPDAAEPGLRAYAFAARGLPAQSCGAARRRRAALFATVGSADPGMAAGARSGARPLPSMRLQHLESARTKVPGMWRTARGGVRGRIG